MTRFQRDAVVQSARKRGISVSKLVKDALFAYLEGVDGGVYPLQNSAPQSNSGQTPPMVSQTPGPDPFGVPSKSASAEPQHRFVDRGPLGNLLWPQRTQKSRLAAIGAKDPAEVSDRRKNQKRFVG
jgi:hypothetical protein